MVVVPFCNPIRFTDDVCAQSEVNDRMKKEGDNKRATVRLFFLTPMPS
jgi:hypothetical protein